MEVNHRLLGCCLPCPWSWFWHHRTGGTPQWLCGLFLWPHAGECCTTAAWWAFECKSTYKHKKGSTVHQYKIYCVFTDAHVSSNSGAFTLSLTFRSAPWLFRALTTSRLPPLQAQCTALEPSWNTVGGPYPIYTADLGPRVAGALVCDDNLTQSHHHPHKQAACPHVLLYLILKVDIGSFL